jgi:cell division protein FtsB
VVLALLAAFWIGSSFASKMYLAYGLNTRVQALRRDNTQLAEANRGYAQQLKSLSNPAGAEEVARQHNYVRPGEKVYVLILPSPSASPNPPSARLRKDSGAESPPSLWQVLWNGITSPFHR